MSIDFLNELENKVNALITTLDSMRQENSRLKQDMEQSIGRVLEMEEENGRLKSELDALKTDSQSNQDKMSVAAEKIQGLLAKLDIAVGQ